MSSVSVSRPMQRVGCNSICHSFRTTSASRSDAGSNSSCIQAPASSSLPCGFSPLICATRQYMSYSVSAMSCLSSGNLSTMQARGCGVRSSGPLARPVDARRRPA
jgi:hypothetical protein